MAGLLIELLFTTLWWIVLFPVIWLLVTPFNLVWALFSELPYPKAVAENYRWVTHCWAEWGLEILPE